VNESLQDIAREIAAAAAANINGVEVFIDEQLQDNFIHIVNSNGIIGAVGTYVSNDDVVTTGYFILNSKILTYALTEGFDIDDIYTSFRKSIFTEMDKEKFISCIAGSKV
jgi:hypothetical protein